MNGQLSGMNGQLSGKNGQLSGKNGQLSVSSSSTDLPVLEVLCLCEYNMLVKTPGLQL